MVGNEIENQTEVVLFQRLAQSLEAGLAAELWIDFGVIDDVIAMGRALARLHERRSIEMRDAELLQIRHDRSGGVEIEVRRQLDAVGRDRNGRRHQRAPSCQNTDQGGITSRVSPPQIGVPVVLVCLWVISMFDRLASSCNVVPSPMRQLAVSKPLSAACASPKAAPASRGTISRLRSADSSRTSASRFFPSRPLTDSQSRTVD